MLHLYSQTRTETIITPFTSDYLSAYLSLCPSPSDAVLAFGPMDIMMAPAPNFIPTRLYNLYPHPAQDASERKRYIVMLTSRCVHIRPASPLAVVIPDDLEMPMSHEPSYETCTPRVGARSTAS